MTNPLEMIVESKLSQYFIRHPVVASTVYGLGSSLVSYLSGLSTSGIESLVIGGVVFVVNLVDASITTSKPILPAASAAPQTQADSTSKAVPVTSIPNGAVVPTFNQGGVLIPYQLNSPIGTTETIGNTTYTVGQTINVAITLPDGTQVPAGAVYIGAGGFGRNGNYWY